MPWRIARPSVLNARLKDTTAGEASESTPRVSSLDRVHDEEVAVHLVALRRSGAHEAVLAAVVAAHEGLAGQVAGRPAPVSSEVTSAGRSTSTQCQKPLGVGASGSKQVTMKLFVPSGAPDQDSCGEVLPSAATWSSLSGWPSVTSSLVTVKDAVGGRCRRGSG